MKTRLLCALALFTPLFLRAQSPGGINSNLRGWYKADAGLTVASGTVSQWNDQSGLGNNATQGTAARRPLLNGTGFNYNPTVTFDGLDDFFTMTDLMSSTVTALSVYAVARQTAQNRDTYGCIIIGQTNNVGSGGGYGFAANGPGNGGFGLFVREYFSNNANFNNPLAAPSMLTGIWNGTTANTIQYFIDGLSVATDPYTPGSVGDNGNSYIGSGIGAGTDYCFYGDIAELVVYNTGLNAANSDRVESYLALKYGITKADNYVNSSGATVFTMGSPYINDVIGIARDDNSGLTQKQSQTQDDTTRIFISALAASNTANAGTFSANNQFVIAGANTGRMKGITTEKPASLFSRIEREWKVQNTGFSSTFNFAIRLNAGANPGSVFPADLRLLVDDDGDFSNATVYSGADGLTFTYVNPVITVSGITTAMIPSNSTKYITIGSGSAATTLPVELSLFVAGLCGDEVCLQWQSAVERNCSHYEIERAGAAGEFLNIGQVSSKAPGGSSRQSLDYFFTDRLPAEGVTYYRLRQVDSDGSAWLSPVVAVLNDAGEAEPAVYSLPGAGRFLLLIPSSYDAQVADVHLYSVGGTEVFKKRLEVSPGSTPVQVEEVPPGIYLCRIALSPCSIQGRVVVH